MPQPDGPISAVTVPGSMSSDTRSSTLWSPNQADTLRASSRDSGPPAGAPPGAASMTMVSRPGSGRGCRNSSSKPSSRGSSLI